MIDRPEYICGILNIPNCKLLVTGLGIKVALRLQGAKNVRVVGTTGNGLLENRRIGGDSPQSIFVNQTFELAAGDIVRSQLEPSNAAVAALGAAALSLGHQY